MQLVREKTWKRPNLLRAVESNSWIKGTMQSLDYFEKKDTSDQSLS